MLAEASVMQLDTALSTVSALLEAVLEGDLGRTATQPSDASRLRGMPTRTDTGRDRLRRDSAGLQ
jgi:hypothetical protein